MTRLFDAFLGCLLVVFLNCSILSLAIKDAMDPKHGLPIAFSLSSMVFSHAGGYGKSRMACDGHGRIILALVLSPGACAQSKAPRDGE